MSVNVGYLDVDFYWSSGRGCAGTIHTFLRAHEHDFCATECDGAEVKAPVFPQHAHHVVETEFLDIEFPRFVDGVNGNHRHYLSDLFHKFVSRICFSTIAPENTGRFIYFQLLYV